MSQLLHRTPKGADKIYTPYEPEVDCVFKGKVRVRCEFGCKFSVATTLDEGLVVGMRSYPGAHYDGNTLKEAPEQVAILTKQRPPTALSSTVDAAATANTGPVSWSAAKGAGLTPRLNKDLCCRSAIEAESGHMKTDSHPLR